MIQKVEHRRDATKITSSGNRYLTRISAVTVTLFCIITLFAGPTRAQDNRGLLLDDGNAVPIKGTFFFAGDRNPFKLPIYTKNPTNGDDLLWLTTDRVRVIEEMANAGINVIMASIWDPNEGTDYWLWWAPMYTSILAVDQLFEAVATYNQNNPTKKVYIIPVPEPTEDATPSGISPEYRFWEDFPTRDGELAPGFMDRIEFYLDRWGTSPEWAKVIDRNGLARHAIHVLGAQSNRLNDRNLFDHMAF
ncbi:MAG: hypothetical protein GY845_18280, partial [Planctomycetes bacterium]|nr:hypothetical protein [Planctomycetota bacterium]